jgi:GT2 family glycosyltransferase
MISISDISIVIVLYQELPPAYIYEDFGVNYILVDNTPGRNLNLDIPNVYYIPLDDNYGIAKALNVGFSLAKKQGFSWVAIHTEIITVLYICIHQKYYF